MIPTISVMMLTQLIITILQLQNSKVKDARAKVKEMMMWLKIIVLVLVINPQAQKSIVMRN